MTVASLNDLAKGGDSFAAFDDGGRFFDRNGTLGKVRENPSPRPQFKTVDLFCGEYTPLSYVVDPIIRTSSVYTLTAKTGAGKTALAVIIAMAIATGRRDILGMDVTQGRVAYLAFENADDTRMRIMIAAFLLNIDLADIADMFIVLDARAKPEDLITELAVLSESGEFALVILDTFAAGFDGKDVNDNVASGEFVRRLRPITHLPGLPALLIPAHPTKNAADDQLVPYGGGAILNEVDGNLCLSKRSETGNTVLHWQAKFRGLEFTPVNFRFEIVGSPDLIDSNGRQVQLPVLRPCSAEDVEDKVKAAANRDVLVLRAVRDDPKGNQRSWVATTGVPLVSLNRKLASLEAKRLVEKTLTGSFIITAKGRKSLDDLD